MKLLVPAAALALLLPGIGIADVPADGPRMDLAGLPRQTASAVIPPGHAMKVTLSGDGLRVEAVPLDAALDNHGPGDFAGCITVLQDMRGSVGSELPYDCNSFTYERHQAPISSVSIIYAGRGSLTADALNFATFGYWFLSCNGPVATYGLEPVPSRGCSSSGSPFGFSNWDGIVQTQGAVLAVVLYNA